MSLENKLILVTGGSTGIGRSIAERCANQGASVLVVSRSAEKIAFSAGPGKIAAVSADVSKACDVARCFRALKEMPGTFHGLVCAAGILGEVGPLSQAEVDEWWKVFEVNVLGTMQFARLATPLFRENGGGRMVFFSGGGQGPQAMRTAYTASKGAIWRFTESLAQELKPEGIYVNAIAPGAVNTKFLQDLLDAGPEKVGAAEYEQALKQSQSGGTPPTKAAELVSYLFSEKAKGLTGKIVSAVWDPYLEFKDLEKMSASEIYTMRRVIDERGGTRFT